ncbi:MAG TPA: GGDEF domain-containing response regulator [Gammaproteobacteria bacterium]|nr:GGDEF domain-containing response regulator [Gammaproteobacteria bacterium]
MQQILIIDPDNDRRRELLRLVRDLDLEPLAVDDNETAVKWLRPAARDTCAVAILTWTGDESARRLLMRLDQPEWRDLPVLILIDDTPFTATAWPHHRLRTLCIDWADRSQLPEVINRLLAPPPPVSRNEEPPYRPTILLVDDSRSARLRFQRLLEREGYRVRVADGPETALQLASREPFDMAILDYAMPNMNGAGLCAALLRLEEGHRPLCAILTAAYEDRLIQESLDAGAVDCLFKNEADQLFLARVASMARDVHMHRRMRRKQQQLQGILASVGDGVYGLDGNGVITYVNPAVSRILGYPEAQLLAGIKPGDLFQVSDEHCLNEDSLGDTFETTFLRADGNSIEVELTVQPLEIDGRKEGAVIAFRDISERKLLENELKWQATHDTLTKLFNRHYLEGALEAEIARQRQRGRTSALLYLDLDRFKYINDTIGHGAGDRLLVELADALRARVRQTDLLARIGGDEFALLLPDIDREHIFAAADEYRKLLEEFLFRFQGRSYNIHGSIGVAVIDASSRAAGDVLSAADLACHIAKGKGRNMTHVLDNEDSRQYMDRELGWSRRLHHALRHDTFELVFQPMVALADLPLDEAPEDAAEFQAWLTGHGDGDGTLYECLLRLRDGHGRLISPGAFMPTAERFNLLADIDRWVIDAAIDRLESAWAAERPLQLSVNLSGQGMSRPDTLDYLAERLRRLQAPADSLWLEITESCVIRHLEAARDCITDLREELGVNFAIDDFGTGYSSLSQLKHLPVDVIKIDGQFVRDIESDPTDIAIVRSIVQIAHASGKRTVAEFVESRAVLRLLQACGVDYAQGFFLSPPRINTNRPEAPSLASRHTH